MQNPFLGNIVQGAWEDPPVDVPSINSAPFQECLRALEQVRAVGRSLGLVVHGPAGAGKTHLLARLRRHLARSGSHARWTPVFAWIKLDTHPGHLWRHLRRSLAENLARTVRPRGWDAEIRQLDLLLAARIAERRKAEGRLDDWWDWMVSHNRKELRAELRSLAQECDWPHDLEQAVFAAVTGQDSAFAWIRGDSLPEETLDFLGLSVDVERDAEDESKRIVLGLLGLASSETPCVVCFDQVEAIVRRPHDPEALFTFGQAIATLHDSTRGVLLVTCVQSSFLMDQLDHIRQADRDRMESYGRRALGGISWEQARELVLQRLRRARVQPPDGAPELWPIDEEALRRFVEDNPSLTVRELLNWCRDQFDEAIGEKLSPASVEDLLMAWYEDQLADIESLPPAEDAAGALVHALGTLSSVFYPDTRPLDDQPCPHLDLSVETSSGPVYIAVLADRNMRRQAVRLRHLVRWRRSHSGGRLVLIQDERTPLTPTARRSHEYLTELAAAGCPVIELDVSVIRHLNVTRTMLALARSGDLAPEGFLVSPDQVEQWLKENAPEEVRALMRRVFVGDSEPLGLPSNGSRDRAGDTLLGQRLNSERGE